MVTTRFTAIADPPEIAKANPIHGEAGKRFGYDGAIVAGISTYGWATTAIIDELGESWLDLGWSETHYRAGVYAGDVLDSTVERDGDHWRIDQRNADGVATVTGSCGLGLAPWLGEFELPTRRDPEPPVDRPPRLDPSEVPSSEDYPPMAVDVTADEARTWTLERLADTHPRYGEGDQPRLHPSWVPGQMTPLIRHSYRFGIGVHASGRVQHLAPLHAGQRVTVAGRWTESFVKKDRQWSTTDAGFLADDGAELARCRQTVVFLG